MCGIIGSFPVADAVRIDSGLESIQHRGPDARQQVETPFGTFGHARLAILDVAEGHQPMQDENNWIVFNGEIYNYQTLRSHLSGPFHTNSDTEVILRCYAEKGVTCPMYLDGMFAFAILDGKDLFLARDPLGIKPLYYAQKQDCLYFASEIKALLSLGEPVHEFPPGYCWHSTYGMLGYDPFNRERVPPAATTVITYEQALQTIYTNLLHSVSKRLIADDTVTVGISLSGGLDSSIIAALAKQVKERIDTFAVGMDGGEDLPASQEMSAYLGTQHHTYIYTFKEMLDALPEVIYHLESFDAALVRSAIPNYFLAKLASDHVKVILTGEGADELFAGYEYLKPIQQPQPLHKELWTITCNLHNTNLQRTDRMTMAHGIEGRVPFLDREVVQRAFNLPAEWKAHSPNRPEKQFLRQAFAGILPESIVHRPKQKFSQGTGSANLMAEYAHETIADADFLEEKRATVDVELRSKEELLYYRIFKEIFGDRIPLSSVGRTRSVTKKELRYEHT